MSSPKPFETSPALRYRAPSYPERFGGRVPRRVRVKITTHPDFPMQGEAACAGNIYDAWTNSYGAVSAVLPDGNLGLKPHEFEVVEWAGVEAFAPTGAAGQ